MTVWAATDSCVVLDANKHLALESLASYLGALGVLAVLTVVVNGLLTATRTVVPGERTSLTPSTPGRGPGDVPGMIEALLPIVEPRIIVFVAGALLPVGLSLVGRIGRA